MYILLHCIKINDTSVMFRTFVYLFSTNRMCLSSGMHYWLSKICGIYNTHPFCDISIDFSTDECLIRLERLESMVEGMAMQWATQMYPALLLMQLQLEHVRGEIPKTLTHLVQKGSNQMAQSHRQKETTVRMDTIQEVRSLSERSDSANGVMRQNATSSRSQEPVDMLATVGKVRHEIQELMSDYRSNAGATPHNQMEGQSE